MSILLFGKRKPAFRIAYAGTPFLADVGDTALSSITVSGGVAPITYAVLSGALPTGLSLNAGSGAITGTYGAVGSFTAVIRATDDNGRTADATLNWLIVLITVNDGVFLSGGYWQEAD